MRGLRKCLGCVGSLLALVMLSQPSSANQPDDSEYEVHWVEKRMHVLQHAKRKASCPLDHWFLCASSVGGGCCPENFECGTASCHATTAGPTSCNGRVGWYSCPQTLNPGGCCPVGLICNDSGGCVPPPGVPFSQSCSAGWIGCPSSLGGGCCRDGQMCGLGVCYNNTPKTYQVSQTVTTTDSRGHTTTTVVTSTTTITEGPNTSAGSPTNVEVPQLILSTVAKMASVETSDSSAATGGLSSGALGGIVTGVIVIFIVIVVAATLIILRLRRAEKAAKDAAERAEDSKRDSSRSPPHSHKSGFGHPAVSEIDSTTDVDPLQRFPIMTPSSHMRSRSGTAGTDDRSLSHAAYFAGSDTSSPPLWGIPFNYAPSVASDGRQSSLDSYPRNDNGPARMPQRVSMDSQGTYGHGRQPSDTSELEGPHGISEIYTTENNGAEAQRRSNSITRPGKHVRRNSDLSGQNRARGDSNAGALRTVNEIFELHGHYGPAHTAAGQTDASLNRGSSATSSPQDT